MRLMGIEAIYHVPPGGKRTSSIRFIPSVPIRFRNFTKGGRIEDLPPLEGLVSAEGLPVGILVEHVRRFIGGVVTVLQDVDSHHEANGLSQAADEAVIRGQGLMEFVPVDQLGGTQVRGQGSRPRRTGFLTWGVASQEISLSCQWLIPQ